LVSLLIFSKAMIEESQAEAPSDRIDALALSFVAYTLMTVLAWGVGQLEWSRRRAMAESTARRQAESRAAMAIERNRIAGELHDIVGHAVTIIVLHAAAARERLTSAPALADESLEHIEDASKQAMRELRGLLRVLRPDDANADGATGSGQPPLHGVADIPTVVEAMRLAGLTVDFQQRGAPVPLDPEADLAAYRIVQESLTNVAKHVGVTAHATVVLDWRGPALVITVEDSGIGQRTSNSVEFSGGHGLLALRERVSAAHGEMTVTIDRRGGSHVEATLPITARR
jgi:signal transduction histidine kinase